ncbi:MAG: hypothetical protein LUE87_05640 [Lachnospiraceae bacterium]|nr:hypothetical protein [Lachnospiraceae bacterium]
MKLSETDREKEEARTLAVESLRENPDTQHLWAALVEFEGRSFFTAKNLEFTYTVKGGELFVSRKEKSITRATVELAFRRALELKEAATGPKKLGVFGASYLYPVLIELGVIPRRSQGGE